MHVITFFPSLIIRDKSAAPNYIIKQDMVMLIWTLDQGPEAVKHKQGQIDGEDKPLGRFGCGG